MVFFVFIRLTDSWAQDANILLAQMDEIMFGAEDRQGTVKIIVKSKSGKGKIREAEMLQKGADKRLYRYTKPENQAGIATLSLPDGVMWLYMPAFGKPKKISFLAKSQAFTGTDFSYEDMATSPYAERFTPKLIQSQGDSDVLELIPMSQKSRYSKIIVTLDKQHHYPKLMEYFDEGGEKFKEATYKYQKSSKYWYAGEVVMTNLRKEHSTRIVITDVKFDQGLPNDLFTVENLRPADPEAPIE